VIGGPFLKKNLSRWAGVTLHWLRGLPTHDATNSFKLYDAAMLLALVFLRVSTALGKFSCA